MIEEYSRKRFDHAQQSATDAIKSASKRAIQRTAEVTGDLICHKIVDGNKKTAQPRSPETVPSKTNKHAK